ncbi:MAG: hypothetical protein PV340_05805 [Wolbachia sp.]|nr:hypothetical protein [Wolbachia sp.]MDD9336434.1 hypothetical protein [Wolbachia sp.]
MPFNEKVLLRKRSIIETVFYYLENKLKFNILIIDHQLIF